MNIFNKNIHLDIIKPQFSRDSKYIKKIFPYSNNFNQLIFTQPFKILSLETLTFLEYNNDLSFFIELGRCNKLITLLILLTRKYIKFVKVSNKIKYNYDYILCILIKPTNLISSYTHTYCGCNIYIPSNGYSILIKTTDIQNHSFIYKNYDKFIFLYYTEKIANL